ncbi:MAG: hypothetical protein DRP89_06480, partial [Candidatus Neomarinimicrobiota bacterium]
MAKGPCLAAFVSGSYAYIGNGEEMDILDVSNPASLTVIG